MEVCLNWGAEGCHPDINKWKSMAEIKKEEEMPTRPEKEELNKTCLNCKALSFKECPNCSSTKIFLKSEFEIKEEGKNTENLSFYCDNCKASFTITHPI